MVVKAKKDENKILEAAKISFLGGGQIQFPGGAKFEIFLALRAKKFCPPKTKILTTPLIGQKKFGNFFVWYRKGSTLQHFKWNHDHKAVLYTWPLLSSWLLEGLFQV